MPATTAATGTPKPGTAHSRYLQSLPRGTYGLRVLGMSLASLPLFVVMHELHSPWPAWTWAFLTTLVWPHLAYFLARRSADPFKAELRNFVVDSLFAGSWVPLLHFNLLPSVVLLTVVMADKVNTGIRGLLLRSLPGMAAAILAMGLLTGFAFAPASSTAVVLASLPILVIHTLAVSVSSYRLLRRVQRQNLQLKELSRVDALTGLSSRGYWEVETSKLLLNHLNTGSDATLVLLDVDAFKGINDQNGHAVGDDVLRAIADLISQHAPVGSHAGRLGGDEFALALPAVLPDAEAIAERIRIEVEAMRLPSAPNLTCSISIGIAVPPGIDLRDWMETADRALYRAKHGGRNRTVGRDTQAQAQTATS